MPDQNRNETPQQARTRAGLPALELPYIAARIFNTPLLIDPDKLQAILWSLSDRMNIEISAPAEESAVMQPAAAVGRWEKFDRERGSGLIIDGGVGILSITGTLVNRGPWIGTRSGMQSYEGIAQQLRMAAEDERIREILLDINSFGGEAAGVSDLASEIRDVSEFRPVTALVADNAASAAYWLASAAREVVVTDSGMVGSIGVVLTHYDFTGRAEQMGIKVTQIHAGADKLLGSPFKSLSDSDRAKLQAEVDQLYELFVSRVAEYRGIDPERIRSTEARTFRGERALETGLADRMSTGRGLLAELQRRTSFRGIGRTSQPGASMTQRNTEGGADAAAATYTQEQLNAAREEGRQAGLAEGRKAGAGAERERVKAILSDAEATERTELAQHLAFETDMPAEAAAAMLAKAPKATSQASTDRLSAAMAQIGTPGVRGAEVQTTSSEARIHREAIYEARRKAMETH